MGAACAGEKWSEGRKTGSDDAETAFDDTVVDQGGKVCYRQSARLDGCICSQRRPNHIGLCWFRDLYSIRRLLMVRTRHALL